MAKTVMKSKTNGGFICYSLKRNADAEDTYLFTITMKYV